MIDLTVYSEQIQTEINKMLVEQGLIGVELTIHNNIGDYQKAKRKDNSVTTYINAYMSSAPEYNETTNDGSDMVTESLTLEIAVPTEISRYSVIGEHQSEDDGVYLFVENVKKTIDTYFSTNTFDVYNDGNGHTYSVGFSYAMSRAGVSELGLIIGEFVPFTVYITLSLVQNGINSRTISMEIDGERVPFQVLSPKRAGTGSSTVYSNADNLSSKVLYTSSTFGCELALPATTGGVTKQFFDYLLGGVPNTIHFVKINWKDYSQHYLMTYGEINATVENSLNVGLTMPLVEVVNNMGISNFPLSYTVAKFKVSNITGMVSFAVNTDCIIKTSVITETSAGTVIFEFSDKDVETDGNNEYFIIAMACPKKGVPVIFSNVAGATMVVLQEGVLNGK